jgi:superfamily I DNA/RNA helicase
MTFTPTDEQLAIVDAARSTKDNLLISALAGAAKTSTLELIAKAVTGVPILCVAFNKKIQLEMEKRLPGHCATKTLNGLGHGVWANAIGRRLSLNTDKTAEILKAEIDKLNHKAKGEAWEEFGEMLRTVRTAKSSGYVPDSFPSASRLMGYHDFYSQLDEEPSNLMVDFVETTLTRGIKQAYEGEIDFDDQLYMPTLFGGSWPKYPLVMVDEAQDLSPLNHRMVDHLAGQRLIAVGDPNQSIYGFRGCIWWDGTPQRTLQYA